MKRKQLLPILTTYLFCVASYATSPHATKTVCLPNGAVVAKLDPFEKDALVLVDAEGRATQSFDLFQFVPNPFRTNLSGEIVSVISDAICANWSTAGFGWYQNSITFVDSEERFLILRLKSDRIIVVDLKKRRLLARVPEHIEAEVEERTRAIALELLESKDARERETGAIVCGQLLIGDAIPRLRELLTDPTAYLCVSSGLNGDEWTTQYIRQYIVRRAAVSALLQMDVVTIGHVVLDRPDPEAKRQMEEMRAEMRQEDDLKARSQKETRVGPYRESPGGSRPVNPGAVYRDDEAE